MIIKDKNICGGSPTIKGQGLRSVLCLQTSVMKYLSWKYVKTIITKQDIIDCLDYVIRKME